MYTNTKSECPCDYDCEKKYSNEKSQRNVFQMLNLDAHSENNLTDENKLWKLPTLEK